MRLLKKKCKLVMMDKEQEVQEQNHVRMNLEMNHHHHDHEKYDQVQYDQVQNIVHIRTGARCVWHRKAKAITIIVKRHSRWTEML